MPSVWLRLVRNCVRWAKRATLLVLLAGALAYLGLIVLQYQPMTIVTGSMQKTIPVGSLVVDRSVDPETLRVGDVISFEKPLGAHGIDTHRIVAIKQEHGRRLFQTKGDSNPIVDPWIIRFDRGMTAHRMAFSVPYLGRVLLVAHSRTGRLALVVYASFVVLLSLLNAIATGAQRRTDEPEAAVPDETPTAPPPAAAPPDPVIARASTHHWEVAYHRGEHGDDGVWRFPHWCPDCATELLARNVVDAAALRPRCGGERQPLKRISTHSARWSASAGWRDTWTNPAFAQARTARSFHS